MKPEKAMTGRVVVSIQGHDKGRWYCVINVDSNGNLLCCDGKYHQMNKPKKKHGKHLKALPLLIDLQKKGGSGGLFENSDLHKKLKGMRLRYQSDTEWNHQFQEETLQDLKKEDCALVQK